MVVSDGGSQIPEVIAAMVGPRPGDDLVSSAADASRLSGSVVTVPQSLGEVTTFYVTRGASTTRLVIDHPKYGPVIGFQGKLQGSESDLVAKWEGIVGPCPPGWDCPSKWEIVYLTDGPMALTGAGQVTNIEFAKDGVLVSLIGDRETLSTDAVVELASAFSAAWS